MDHNGTNKNNRNDEIDLRELSQILLDKKFFISSFTSITALFSIIYSLYLPDIYTSSTLLAPSSQEESLSSSLGGLSGLASMAGVNIPKGSITKSQIAVKRIESHEFFAKYFLPNILLENLMAVEKWQPNGNHIVYDSRIFDKDSNTWVRKISYPKQKKPSSQESFQEYKKILQIDEDKETGLVTISIRHQSPHIAKKWIDVIIININESMRSIDIENAQNSINFLNETTPSVSIQSLKSVITNLLEIQMQTLTLASSNKAYVFEVINSSLVSEEKSGPNRSLTCIIVTILGAMFAVIISLITHFRRST